MKTEIRPIGARALKSAMDSLRPELPSSRVLDLFAGQGRFGIACLEEGAAFVEFVEKNRKAAGELGKALTRNSAWVERYRVSEMDALLFLQKKKFESPFEIVFADPPFPLWDSQLEKTINSGIERLLAPQGIFLLKYPTRNVPWLPTGFRLRKESEFGESILRFFDKE